MGKQTTKFMNSIGTMIDQCEAKVDEIGTLVASRKPLNQQAMVHIQAMDDVAEKHMPGGTQTEGSEERVVKDPAYIKASAKLDEVNHQIMLADGKIRTAKNALDNALDTLQAENAKFEKFVVAKKKKWLVSKKSVPAAEACIKSTKEYIADCRLLTL